MVPTSLEVFDAKAPGNSGDFFAALVLANPQPSSKVAEFIMSFSNVPPRKDPAVVTDRSTRLRDGTPAREVEIRGVANATPVNWRCVCIAR